MSNINFILSLLFIIFHTYSSLKIFASEKKEKNLNESQKKVYVNLQLKNQEISNNSIKWEILKNNSVKSNINPQWEKYSANDLSTKDAIYNKNNEFYNYYSKINSLNRSIIFNNNLVGPDISWLVPPGLSWNKKYKFDASIRGHNRRSIGEPFFGWNSGDAVGQFYYHPFRKNKLSFGLNLGMRSVYEGTKHTGGGTSVGEGLSGGFRLDYELSETSGLAFGAEQLLHFDGLTDTGRDIYLTISKGFWNKKINGINTFPLYIATAGVGTGKMAEGNIKGLCSNMLGGSGTEVNHQRSLCWAPIFSIARVQSQNFSTFFEYNSKWFLLGSSIAPFDEIPLRGTFALQISDHIDNYKVNNFNELKWIFRISLGF